MKVIFVLVFAAMLFIGSAGMYAQSDDSSAIGLINFRLKDQFNREYTRESWGDSIVVVFGSDRDGSDYNREWAIAIQDSLKDEDGFEHVRFVAVADLRGVPFFLKGIVKNFFPKEDSRLWILLDWGGEFAKFYDFRPKKSNIIIFNREQQFVDHYAVTQLAPATLDSILTTLRTVYSN